MENRISNKLWCLFLLLSITQVCRAQLMCYVCDDCAQITSKTPQFQCNEDFFNAGGNTDSSVQTTTEMHKTSAGVTEPSSEATTPTPSIITDETTMSTTEMKPSEDTTMTTITPMESTTEMTSAMTTVKSTESTEGTTTTIEDLPPSPPTVGPPMTTTAIPTPPNPGTIQPLDDVESLNNQSLAHQQPVDKEEVEDVEIEHSATVKNYKPSAEFRVRQLRSVSDVTYHCFKVQATTINGTMVTNRGCSRVQTMESVCGQWEAQHPNEKMNKCYPCSRTKCNGSSTLNVSISALIVAVIAVFMHRK